MIPLIRSIIYLILLPIVYTYSFIGFVFIMFAALVSWIFTGEVDGPDGGLVGFLYKIASGLDYVNVKLHQYRRRYMPMAWTFRGAVSNWKKSVHNAAVNYSGNYEYRKELDNMLAQCALSNSYAGKKMYRYWTYVKERIIKWEVINK